MRTICNTDTNPAMLYNIPHHVSGKDPAGNYADFYNIHYRKNLSPFRTRLPNPV
jgi:hypothetical protein